MSAKEAIGRHPKAALLIAAGTLAAGAALCSQAIPRETSQSATDFPPTVPPAETLPDNTFQLPTDPPSQPDGWDCAKFYQGDWPLNEIRRLGIPGKIDPGPYRYTDRHGKVHTYNNWREFNKVYPGEEICVQKPVSQSLNSNGTVYESSRVKHQNTAFINTSKNIQAAIRAKQGF